MQLTDRTILVTGGGSGIGLGLASALLARGNRVVICGRTASRLEQAREQHPGLVTAVCDVADPAAVEALAARMEREFPALDVVINNAGVGKVLDLRDEVPTSFRPEEEIAINLLGPIRVTAALLPLLRRQPRATLVNVSSGLAYVPLPTMPIYCATKAALHSFTLTLRQQLAGTNVEVVELVPPAVATELTDNGAYKPMPLDTFIQQAVAGLESGAREVRVGQSRFLHLMSRMAPALAERALGQALAAYRRKGAKA